MRLTQYTDYSLRVLLYLATYPDKVISTHEITDAFNISHNHLIKVVNQLGHMNYIRVKRGRGGGIRLAVDPDKIVVGDVVRRTEPGFKMVECFKQDGQCTIQSVCGLSPVIGEALNAFPRHSGQIHHRRRPWRQRQVPPLIPEVDRLKFLLHLDSDSH